MLSAHIMLRNVTLVVWAFWFDAHCDLCERQILPSYSWVRCWEKSEFWNFCNLVICDSVSRRRGSG